MFAFIWDLAESVGIRTFWQFANDMTVLVILCRFPNTNVGDNGHCVAALMLLNAYKSFCLKLHVVCFAGVYQWRTQGGAQGARAPPSALTKYS